VRVERAGEERIDAQESLMQKYRQGDAQ